jgi:hypothetical protein
MNTKKQSIRSIRHGARGVRWCLGIVVTISAAACAPSPEPPHQTVEYYRANREAREARLAECANDPGALGKTPDCINVRKAAEIEGLGSLRDLKPLGLSKETPGRNESGGGSPASGNEQSPGEPK